MFLVLVCILMRTRKGSTFIVESRYHPVCIARQLRYWKAEYLLHLLKYFGVSAVAKQQISGQQFPGL